MPLTPKAFETLLVLVESGGRILDKEDLLKKVWPDTFVEEVSLAKKISILRKVLGEDFENHYIETIPRRGYRFVAEVREVWQEGAAQFINQSEQSRRGGERESGGAGEREKAEDGLETATPPRAMAHSLDQGLLRSFAGSLRWSAVFLAIGMLAGLIIWRLGPQQASLISRPPLNGTPLTTFQGRETQAAFSPDGDQIAFVWNGPHGDNPDIYVKLIDAETPLRLTNNTAADTKPVWSPDGRYIAFLRQLSEGSAFYLIPALGGAERKLVDIFPYQVPGDGNSPYYSPDGKYLAIPDKNSPSEPLSIFLLSVETGEKRKITSAPAGALGDYYPAFSPDGKMLAFVRATRWSTDDLYVMPVSGGEPRRLTFDNLTLTGLTWTPDSREIMFTSRRGGSTRHLWRVAATGGTPERVDTVGNDVLSPALSPKGNRLAYTQALDDVNIWRIELDAAGRSQSQRELIASTFWDHGPDYSPDGRKIVFASGRSGSNGIWVCESDGSKPRLLHACGPYVTGTPRWSPDGRWIVFDSRSCATGADGNPDIYLISADGGQPRRLTTDLAEDVVPSWSRDGRWIYFGSTRSGNMQIWKIPAEGGAAIQITERGGFEGFESPDGRDFYYTKGRGIPGIWRAPTAGGKEVSVISHHQAGLWRYWRVVDQGIYFASATTTGPLLEFFSFATGQVSEISRPPKGPERFLPGLAISPNGRTLLYCQMDHSGSDIMMVENFH
ncbi:MAG: winged helix-turn-helix domain-containing protein [Acidobacteria bacterium]|nr:winged helix-turn-helix domain-containing protein [Acidobacteriota bacterium]